MTREEEIKKQADIYTDNTSNYTEWGNGWEDFDDRELVEKAFIEGAKWADETMIAKACEWLEKQQNNYNLTDAWNGDFISFVHFMMDFCKAMKED